MMMMNPRDVEARDVVFVEDDLIVLVNKVCHGAQGFVHLSDLERVILLLPVLGRNVEITLALVGYPGAGR